MGEISISHIQLTFQHRILTKQSVFRSLSLLYFLAMLPMICNGGPLMSEEEVLMEYLFEDYNPSARPVLRSSSTVNVQMMFSLLHIQDLDVRSQILTATGLLILDWKDERLTWDPNYFNQTNIVIEARYLWVPEFAVINGAEEIYGDYTEFRALITSNGAVHWEPGGIFKTMCQIDITYFPFDDQSCSLQFGAWSYHTSKMNLTNSSDIVNMDSYERNGEWEIINSLSTRQEFSYDCCPNERYSFVSFTLNMRRRYTFYVMNVILPSMVTSILLLSIFYCPPSQKVQIGVVVLLSFRIFLLNVTDSIPKTSDHIPLLGIYLTCTMAITTLSMVLTVLVLNLHSIADRPVPGWLRIIVLQYLARLFCKCEYVEHKPKHRLGSAERLANHIRRKRHHFSNSLTSLPDSNDTEQVPIIAINGGAPATLENGGTKCAGLHPDEGFVYIKNHKKIVSPRLTRGYKCNMSSMDYEGGERSTQIKPPDYGKEWQKLAEVVDRLFFWLFLFAIVAVSLLLFHPLALN